MKKPWGTRKTIDDALAVLGAWRPLADLHHRNHYLVLTMGPNRLDSARLHGVLARNVTDGKA